MPATTTHPTHSASSLALPALVAAALAGDEAAWTEIVARFERHLHATARWASLSSHDAEDVVQTTWLRLVENLDKLRTPEALGAWLAITARREGVRVIQAAQREVPTDDAQLPELAVSSAPEADLIAAERRQAFRHALAGLPPRDQGLLSLLMQEPAPSYREIAAAAGMPVGSVGPTRERCLERMRRNEHIARAAADV